MLVCWHLRPRLSSLNSDQPKVLPMFLLKKLLSAWLLPPLGLLVLALLALCWRGHRRSGRIVACCALALALCLSLPFVTERISRPLEGASISAAQLRSVQAIVILGGGVHLGAPEYGGDTLSRYSLERVRYGARLAHESKLPVLVSGGSVYGGQAEANVMKLVLENEFGVPVRWTEAQSRDTAENALYSAKMLKAANIQRIALVTQAGHMSRATAAFEKLGLHVVPAATGFTPQGASLFESLLPSMGALERSANAIHEWVGALLLG